MNEQQPKPKNKKQLTYYLILGACILVIAAVALAVTLSLTLRKDDIQLDNDQTQNDDDDGGDDDATDTSGDNTFGMPVTAANALNEYGFYHNTTLDKYYLHAGIDFAGEVGDEVFAALDGTVESIVTDARLMGTTITLSHANGLKTTYTFVDALEGLETGDVVEKGDVIATVAEPMGQEYKDGAHLHFEVFLNGSVVDPDEYLDIDGK
ncbi:MAG TPA: M23 family metallopeptidase [Candidatus Coproplasma avistercoris]|nr:M23 family metallopeptidase [Candidatus Coproplasma avistercoris]